jgi:hypothetical protein
MVRFRVAFGPWFAAADHGRAFHYMFNWKYVLTFHTGGNGHLY